MLKIVSLFSGCGGLDLGFSQAGFDIIWANEYDKEIWETYEKNHPKTYLDRRNIKEIKMNEIPDCNGIIGGPPCQSWSEAGSLRGINDSRGKLFYDFIKIIRLKKPLFFFAENVRGMLASRNFLALQNIKKEFLNCGYNISLQLLNVADYNVPQDRKRLIFVGIRKDLNFSYVFPSVNFSKKTLKDTIYDIKNLAIPAIEKNKKNVEECSILNHEYLTGDYSSIYMSRNRVRSWEEQSFTIQASGRHAPLHPQAPKMFHIDSDKYIFQKGFEHLYRRLSVRECARIQTFPDNFKFYYKNLMSAYKMIGNAVPVQFSQTLAKNLYDQIQFKNLTLNKTSKNYC